MTQFSYLPYRESLREKLPVSPDVSGLLEKVIHWTTMAKQWRDQGDKLATVKALALAVNQFERIPYEAVPATHEHMLTIRGNLDWIPKPGGYEHMLYLKCRDELARITQPD